MKNEIIDALNIRAFRPAFCRKPLHNFTRGEFAMQVNKNLGMLLLGIWLVLTGLIQLLNFGFSGLYVIMALLAIAAGVLIGLGK
jgi:hypothetical protein